jgi:hypothetical protein
MAATEPSYTGTELVGEMFELVRDRLPLIPEEDPLSDLFGQMLHALGRAFGGPRAVLAHTRGGA